MAISAQDDFGNIVMGKILGAFGIKGWVKVVSFTDPTEQLLQYRTWHCSKMDVKQSYKLKSGQLHSKGLIAKLEHINDRDAAELLAGYEIAVNRSTLPPLAENEYYWSDLIGLKVINQQGIAFGEVSSMIETGANDVLVVNGDRERLVPWTVGQAIVSVSLSDKLIIVDWDAEF